MLDSQINSIVTQPDWSKDLINPSDSETNIYMMDEIEFESEAELEKCVRSASHHRAGRLVNLLINDIGTQNKVCCKSYENTLAMTGANFEIIGNFGFFRS